MTRARTTTRDRLRALSALLGLLTILGSVPALWNLAGRPWPDHVPTLSEITAFARRPLSDQALVLTLLTVAALWWLTFTTAVVVELVARARGAERARRMTLLGAAQPLARHLLAATLSVVVPVTPMVPAYANTVPVAATAFASDAPQTPAPPRAAAAATAEHRTETRAGLRVYEVKAPRGGHHDTLWNAAKQHLRDPRRYVEIIELNLGRTMTDGQVFTADHRLVQPGWRLLMPADATGLPLATSNDRHERTTQRSDTRPGPGLETTVESGDSLWTLGEAALRKALGRPPSDAETAPYVEQVVAANHDRLVDPSNPGLVYAGQRVTLPPVPGVHQPGTSQPAERPTLPERPSAMPTATPTSPPAPTPTPAPASTSPNPTDEPHHLGRPASRTVTLPDGSVVAASLLAAVASAAAIGRLRRRRRFTPGALGSAVEPPARPGPLMRAAIRTNDESNDSRDAASPVSWLYAGLAETNPAVVPIGHHEGDPVLVDLMQAGPLALTMTDPDGLARAVLASFVARGPSAARALIPADLYDVLLPGIEPPSFVERVPDVQTALDMLAAELVARARLFESYDETEFAEYRSRHPDDNVPALLLISRLPSEFTDHAASLLTAGRRLGVTALFVGEGIETGMSLRHDMDGRLIVEPEPSNLRLTGADSYTLTCSHAAEAFAAVAGALTDPTPVTPVALPNEDRGSADAEVPPAPPQDAPKITVRVLGTYSILFDGRPIRSGLLRDSRELVAFLVVHPQGATMERIVDALDPDAQPKQVRTIFWNAVGRVRKTLRELTGDPTLDPFERDGDVFRLAAEHVGADLWEFYRSLAHTRDADPTALRDALHRASRYYSGELLQDMPYDWAEEARERLRLNAVEGLTRLAEAAQARADLGTAQRALEQAVDIGVLVEDVYRRLMRLHLSAGRHEDVHVVYRRLVAALRPIGTEPEEATEVLVRAALRAEVDAAS